jgi:hypothetical protein
MWWAWMAAAAPLEFHSEYGHFGQWMWTDPPDWRGLQVRATASSALRQGRIEHSAVAGLGQSAGAAWCEGVPGQGLGEWLELSFDEPVHPYALMLRGGYFLDERRLRRNSRPRLVRVDLDGYSVLWHLADPVAAGFEAARQAPAVLHPVQDPPPWPSSTLTTRVRLTLLEVYPGEAHEDTCISGFYVDVRAL